MPRRLSAGRPSGQLAGTPLRCYWRCRRGASGGLRTTPWSGRCHLAPRRLCLSVCLHTRRRRCTLPPVPIHPAGPVSAQWRAAAQPAPPVSPPAPPAPERAPRRPSRPQSAATPLSRLPGASLIAQVAAGDGWRARRFRRGAAR